MTKAPPDPEKMKQAAERRRRRLLHSLNDLQQALRACSFLYECDEQGTYSKPSL
jgi:ribosomal protein L32